MTTRLDPDELAALEEERDFLLRSLDDLERERAESALSDADYERLHDDYTARAAAAIRAVEEREDARPAPPPVPARRRALAVAAVVVFAVVAAALLTRSLGERLPGESLTGNEQVGSDLASLMLRAGELADEGEAAQALRLYDEAARLDPSAPEPRARAAWIVFNAGLPDEALRRLDEAQAADPSYADAWFVRGVVLFRGRGDAEGARAAFARYLELAPDGPYAEDARVVIAELEGKEPPP